MTVCLSANADRYYGPIGTCRLLSANLYFSLLMLMILLAGVSIRVYFKVEKLPSHILLSSSQKRKAIGYLPLMSSLVLILSCFVGISLLWNRLFPSSTSSKDCVISTPEVMLILLLCFWSFINRFLAAGLRSNQRLRIIVFLMVSVQYLFQLLWIGPLIAYTIDVFPKYPQGNQLLFQNKHRQQEEPSVMGKCLIFFEGLLLVVWLIVLSLRGLFMKKEQIKQLLSLSIANFGRYILSSCKTIIKIFVMVIKSMMKIICCSCGSNSANDDRGTKRHDYSGLDDLYPLQFAAGDGVDDSGQNMEPCDMYTASIISQMYYLWIWPLLLKGYRNKQVQQQDLGSLDGEDRPINNVVHLLQTLDQRRRGHLPRLLPWLLCTCYKPLRRQVSLLAVLYYVHADLVLLSAFHLFVSTVAAICSLFVLKELLQQMDEAPTTMDVQGYWLALALFVLKIIESTCEHQFWIVGTRACMRMQSALVAATCYYTLRLSPAQANLAGFDPGSISTLITVDARKVSESFVVPMLHWGTWGSLIPLGTSLVVLYSILGNAAFVGVAILIGVWPITVLLARYVKVFMTGIQEAKSARGKLFAEILRQVRFIKAFNRMGDIIRLVTEHRSAELSGVMKYQINYNAVSMITEVALLVAPVVSFLYFTMHDEGTLTASVVFTSLAWFNYMQRSLRFLPMAVACFHEVVASTTRLDALFNIPVHETAAIDASSASSAGSNSISHIQASELRSPWLKMLIDKDQKQRSEINRNALRSIEGIDGEEENSLQSESITSIQFNSINSTRSEYKFNSPALSDVGSDGYSEQFTESLLHSVEPFTSVTSDKVVVKQSSLDNVTVLADDREQIAEIESLCAGRSKGIAESSHVTIRHAYFTWGPNSSTQIVDYSADALVPVLSDINLTISEGQLVFVIGLIGTGKSSLLLSLLGETILMNPAFGTKMVGFFTGSNSTNMLPYHGELDVVGTTAYVSDRPWIFNKTIRDNIVFGRPWNPSWYSTVIMACCLAEDLTKMPNGDLTEAGERGVNLSGGQQQRIHLARAIYAKPDIILVDDCFSALDAKVGKTIFDSCFSSRHGILRSAIRVVVTHQHNLLHESVGDRCVVLGSGGTITFTGTVQEVLESTNELVQAALSSRSRSTYADSLAQDNEEAGEDGPINETLVHSLCSEPDGEKYNTYSVASIDSESTGTDSNQQRTQSVVGVAVVNNYSRTDSVSATKFVMDETKESSEVKWSVIMKYVRRFGAGYLVYCLIFLIILDQMGVLFQSLLYSRLANKCDDTPNSMSFETPVVLRHDQVAFNESYYTDLSYFPVDLHANFHVPLASSSLSGVFGSMLESSNLPIPTVLLLSINSSGVGSYFKSSVGEDMGPSNCSDHSISGALISILLLIGGIMFVRILRLTTFIFGAQSAARSMHDGALTHLLYTKVVFFDRQLSGRILNRIVADVSSIDLTVPGTLYGVVTNTLTLFTTFILIASQIPVWSCIALVVLGIPNYIIYAFYRWPARDLKRIDSVAKSPINSHIIEMLSGLAVIRGFGCQLLLLREHLTLAENSARCYWYQWAANQWITTTLEFLGILFTGSVLFACVYSVNNELVSPATAGMLISVSQSIPGQIGWMLKMYCSAEIESVAIERIGEYLELQPEAGYETIVQSLDSTKVGASETQVKLPNTDRLSRNSVTSGMSMTWLPSTSSNINESNSISKGPGHICLDNVSLCYDDDMFEHDDSQSNHFVDGISTNNRSLILKGVTFTIQSGEKVAICGRTGAGKTSIFQALLRFYTYHGLITVDDINLNSLSVAEARKLFSWVPQESVLIGNTLAEALFGQPKILIDDIERVGVMFHKVGLDAKIAARGGIYSTVRVGDDGFSAGERQLLCTVRALLKPSHILLCDELASALDHQVESKVHEVILSDSRTVICIMHRLEYIHSFDKVIIMDDGKVAEIGVPTLLASDPNSHLSSLIRASTKASVANGV